jgi:hypothetical protein
VGKETKTLASEELWHLGIGDLPVSAPESEPIVLFGPFVINLRTSSTPIGGMSNALQRFPHVHVYQLERHQEGQWQYLLRVGIIETDLEADAILATVHAEYPEAFKASAGDDDVKAVAARQRILTAKAATPKPAPQRPVAPRKSQRSPATTARRAAAPPPAFRWNIDEVLPELGAPPNLRSPRPEPAVVPPPTHPPAPPRPASLPAGQMRPPAAEVAPPEEATVLPASSPVLPASSPVLPASSPVPLTSSSVERSELDCDPNAATDQVEAPVFTFETSMFGAGKPQPPEVQPPAAEASDYEASIGDFDSEAAALPPTAIPPTPAPQTATPSSDIEEVSALEMTTINPAPAESERADCNVASAEPEGAVAPPIERTQTIRALTCLELEDEQTSRWFAIQLLSSEKDIDPHEVPNLGIFAEYRLYAVRELDQDRVMHALRLGFFSSETAAEAVAGYLGSFFDSPRIKRVSLAEHERFEEGRVTAGKDVGAADGHVAIELAGPAPSPLRQAYERLAAKRRPDSPKVSSIWSRLLPTRKS